MDYRVRVYLMGWIILGVVLLVEGLLWGFFGLRDLSVFGYPIIGLESIIIVTIVVGAVKMQEWAKKRELNDKIDQTGTGPNKE